MPYNIIQLKYSDNNERLLELFGQHLLKSDRPNSLRSYLGDVRRFSMWLRANLLSVSPLDITEYRRFLQKKGLKPSTINRALISIKLFYGFLIRQGVVKDNPAEDVKPVAVVELAPKWLTRQEQAALMRAVRESGNARDEAVIALMLHAGLRISEVTGLKREDIHMSERSGYVVVRQGKGNKQRQVPLNKTARKIISRWLEANLDSVLFPNREGKPMSDRAIRQMVEKYAYRAKLKNVSPHTLRHTFCKNLIDAGVPIDQVAVMAGHSKLEVTRRYTVPSMQDLQVAVERTSWE